MTRRNLQASATSPGIYLAITPWRPGWRGHPRGRDFGWVADVEEDPQAWLKRYTENLRHGWTLYRPPRSTGQPRRTELWCEAAGMHDQLQRIAARYRWSAFNGGGAESLTARYDLVQRCIRQPDLPTDVLHVGDHDPSGHDIFNALRDDVTAFVAADAPDTDVTFIRVAVNLDQVTRLLRWSVRPAARVQAALALGPIYDWLKRPRAYRRSACAATSCGR